MTNKTDPATFGVAITPHDSTDFTQGKCRGIYVGGAGDAVLIQEGNAITYTGLLAGSFYPFECTRVNSTSTTATNLVALY
jgi:hypothetical protein